MKDLLLITPPFTQLNTPYPATAYLKGFLNTKNITSFQIDLGMEVILEIFSKKGLTNIFDFAVNKNQITTDNSKRIYALKEDYLQNIDQIISFLQGKNQTFARQICIEDFLPQASRFQALDDLEWAFGNMGVQDKAKHLATLFLEDISDFIIECVDENFGFSRYAERLGRSANSFDEIYQTLNNDQSYIDKITLEHLERTIKKVNPKLICFSVPFPGNLYSSFRCAQLIKTKFPSIKTAMGGGFPNTELRSLSDERVFWFFDYITLDDGELPIELLYANLTASPEYKLYKRTFLLDDGKVFYNNLSLRKDYKQSDLGTPDYADLKLDKYISVIEIANPMHSLWSDGRWNKLTMAHGCYWGKCTFCDVSLDYIKLYEPVAASLLVDRMEEIIAQTHENGFHFVDEAAPPALMRALAIEIIKRKLKVTWWTNIRFEKSFTKGLCVLLKNSGCIAVSGGLEVASDRLLILIQKGVTVEQVAKVTNHFTETGIMVHAYLMYGYPTQTIQETIDSLEMVRQMFELGILQSGFWHQFALTAHSPVGLSPAEYGIIPEQKTISFAHNDIQFKDKTGIDHDKFSLGLKKSLFNYMHGICFDFSLQEWFDFKIPKTNIKPDFIKKALETDVSFAEKGTAKVIWLGNKPTSNIFTKSKKGNSWEMMQLVFQDRRSSFEISVDKDNGDWLLKTLNKINIHQKETLLFNQLKADYETTNENFELFWYSKPIKTLKENG
ncbi:MAG: radical SAM protein, partial [Oligoflexus sp.]|nr:radical SAM protein [Pseudopedobacter sp.]